MTDLLQRVQQSIQKHRLLRRGERFLIAVSGGLDSMTLLHLLHALSPNFQWRLTVAHFNHRLRGRSSDADERLVRRRAAALKLPLEVAGADVRRFANQSKVSVEMAARRLRHAFLAQAAKRHRIRTLVLAHHADDQVELFFVRLLRGAGGAGLAGMKWRTPSPAAKDLRLVRPLLDVPKAELAKFARQNKIRFRDDATNARLDAPRNRIRNELLPLLRQRYQPGLTRIVLRLMEIVGAESDFVGRVAQAWLREGDWHLPGRSRSGKTAFDDLPVAVQRRVLQQQLLRLGMPTDFDLVERLRGAAGHFISVKPGCSVAREATGTLDWQSQEPTPFNPDECTVRLVGGAGEAGFDGLRMRWRLAGSQRVWRPRHRTAQEHFDADQVGSTITLRHWRPGDRFQPIGFRSAIKLQDWFVNQKVPRPHRRQLVVAATQAGEIFWIEGLRIGERFKLLPGTRRRLIWRWRRGP